MNILDSSAFLALILHETGHEKVDQLIKKSQQKKESLFMHQINFIEVIYKAKQKLSDQDARQMLAEFSSPWWGKLNYMDSDLMLLASELKNKFKNASLADCIGLAVTKLFQATFWTADSLLAKIGDSENISVKLIR
jgi:predicted nucleic acid-binding protein